MLEELLHLDKELFLYLNNLGSSGWDGFWMFVTRMRSWFPMYLVLLILAYRQFGLRKTFVLMVAVALLITCTDQLANFFKDGLQRLRPCHDPEVAGAMRLVKGYCGGKYGYFSAHASNSFGIAFFLTWLMGSKYRYIGIFLIVWAIFVAYSRIYIGVHFPLDVLTGGLIGVILGWLFAKLYIFALHKYHV